jgi:hypothetical protein
MVAGEKCPDRAGHSASFVLDLAPGEPENLEAEKLQARVTGAVLLERRAGAVRFPAVDLDDQALRTSEEVDLVTVDAGVHLRPRQPMAADQGHEQSLQVGAGARRLRVGIQTLNRQPQELGLPEGRSEDVARE